MKAYNPELERDIARASAILDRWQADLADGRVPLSGFTPSKRAGVVGVIIALERFQRGEITDREARKAIEDSLWGD
jgi:hypothetical protein